MMASDIGMIQDLGVEVVEIYSATVETDSTTVGATSVTVLVAPYTMYDGSNSLCSAALLDASEWTKVTRKSRTGRLGRPPSMQGSTERSQEASHVKE
jgi:hypothetical protein